MQSFLEVGTESQFCVLEVIHCDFAWSLAVDLAFQGAAVGRVNPILSHSILIVDEKVPTVHVKHPLHADIILG